MSGCPSEYRALAWMCKFVVGRAIDNNTGEIGKPALLFKHLRAGQ